MELLIYSEAALDLVTKRSE